MNSSTAEVAGPRRYRNNDKMVRMADPAWQAAADAGLIDLDVGNSGGTLVVAENGHRFVNLCSCSYLGLNNDPRVVQGAVDALRHEGTTALSASTTRIRPALLTRLEDELGRLFRAEALVGLSCSALVAGVLPLLASGHLTGGEPRVLVFDRNSHFCLSYVKPVCGDETLVLTGNHNDLDQLEDICKRYPSVAYVADGAYSMGGTTPLEGLLELQDRYGLALFFDDSHSLSVTGEHGEGYVRSNMELNPLTFIVASLHKAFGAKGGVLLFADRRVRDIMLRHGGALTWSQNVGVADIGAALASAAIHGSPELSALQRKLQRNIDQFDQLFPTSFAGNGLTIRVLRVGDANVAIRCSAELFRRGYYSSAVFFPIVARGEAGIRIMIRADLEPEQISEFTGLVKDFAP